MKRAVLFTTVVAFALVAMTTIATAQQSQVIHFQGMLTAPDSRPMRDAIYEVNFSIWDHATNGVEALWSEIQMVETTNGLFDVFLGSDIPLSADVFTHAEGDSDLRFLEIQVIGDDPMTPRTQIGKTPNSFVSSRVLGDIVTGPGSFRMAHPPEGPGVEMIADGIANFINFRLGHPPEQPTVDILSDAAQTSFKLIDPGNDGLGFEVFIGGEGNSIKLMDPTDEGGIVVGLEMMVDANGNSFKLMDPGDDGIPAFDFLADGMNNIHSFKLMEPADDGVEVPAIEMTADASGNSFKLMDPGDDGIPAFDFLADGMNNIHSFKLMEPADDGVEVPAIEMMADLSGSSFKVNLAEPPDEKQGVEIMTSNTGPAGSQASFKMFNPQPEPPADPLLEMNTNQYGANFAMTGLQGDYLPAISMNADGLNSITSFKLMEPGNDGSPAIEMTADGGTNTTDIRLMDPGNEGGIVEISAIGTGLSSGASFKMFNPQPEPPADPLLEMITNQYGANFAMAAPQAGLATDITNPMVEIKTDSDGGSISLFDDIGKYMGFDPMLSTPGGAFYMDDPSTEQTNVWIESSGRVSARKGIFGYGNISDGNYNLVVGSYNNITGSSCFAGGYDAQVDHNYCFVWSDSLDDATTVSTSDSNQFLVRSTGGVAFYTNSSLTYGVSLGPGDYTWNSILPGLTARNSRDVDGSDILNKIEQLPIKQFTVEGENNQTKHISPVPEDFNRLFGVGADDNRISMLDPSGVALAGVQALLDKIEKLEKRIAELERNRR